MRYRLSELPALLLTPIGRKQLRHGILIRTTPIHILAARLYRRFRLKNVKTVTVIGSFGKTTTTRCLFAALGMPENPRLEGNRGISLARNIRRIKPSDRFAVLETGISGPGQMKESADMARPDIVVVTCIGSEHNRSFRTLEATRQEKSVMVSALDDRTGLAVLNGDDPNVLWMAKRTGARCVTYGLGPENDVRADDIRLDWPRGTRFILRVGDEEIAASSPFYGTKMIYPVLAAAAVAREAGEDLSSGIARIEKLPAFRGRLQPVTLDSGAVVLRDDYKSAEETIYAALDLLEEIPARRKFVVMGEVNEPRGNQRELYRKIGRRIGEMATHAFFVCGKKMYRHYVQGTTASGMDKDRAVWAGKQGLAQLAREIESLSPGDGDIILVKGRDNQRLERLTFALQGRIPKCELEFCDAKSVYCDVCPMLDTGWEGRKVVF
jgi:UDP-N-acetylmuramoyl-tripeptide--D-alanyl-D-alanine ligase